MAPLREGQFSAATSGSFEVLSEGHLSPGGDYLTKLSVAAPPKWRSLVKEVVRSSRGRLSLLICWDLFAVAIAVNVGYVASPGHHWHFDDHVGLWPVIVPLGFAFVLSALSSGFYEKPDGEGNLSLFLRSTVAAVLAWAAVIVCQYAVRYVATGRWVVIIAGVTLIAVALSGRLLLRQIQKRMPVNVIVLGNDRVARCIRREGERKPYQPFRVGAVAPMDCETTLSFPANIPSNFRVGGQDKIDWIVVQGSCDGTTLQELLPFFRNGTRIGDVGMFFETFFQKVPVEVIDTSWLIQANVSLVTIGTRGLKRGTDILTAVIGLALTVPLWPAIALLIKLSSKGPVFYRQERVGRHGKVFHIHKFRTMTVEAESSGKVVWASRGDNRVTAVGRLLRKTRLDELPQFINVLLGHMSLVGPRPERPEFVRMLAEKVPHYQLRHLVRPGITGWAQISYRYAASLEDSAEKLRYDLYYVKYGGFLLDLQIMI